MPIALEIARGRYRIESPLVVNEKDGSILVWVPAGAFEMGDGRDSNCPKHEVELSQYWIGVYCVTNRQYARFVQETRRGGAAAPDGKEHHPVVNVTWDDARAYCQWAGGELPTEAQWEKAARGPQGLVYPWGNEWDVAKCRNNDNRGNEQTTTVWGYAAGASGYGTYQQSGNVWEWCGDWYGDGTYKQSPRRDPAGPKSGSDRVLRGGSWGYVVPAGCRAAGRCWNDPALRYGSLGFRLVRTV